MDGVELLDFRSQIDNANYGAAGSPAQRVLPSSSGLDLDLPVVGRDEFKSAKRFMSEARSMGFKVTCNFVPMWSGSDKLTGASLVDIRGRHLSGPADFPVHGCPNNPDMLRFGEYMIREFVRRWPDMEIMALNHLEYPYVIHWKYPKMDVDCLFSCFCEECERAAGERGLDFARMKGEVKSFLASLSRPSPGGKGGLPMANADDVTHFFLRRPYLADWLRFRMDSLTGYSRSLIAAGRRAAKEHNPKLRFGMEFQLPSLSPILGTDFLSLSADLDLMIPKFPDYLAGSVIPLFAKEVATRSGLDEGELFRLIRDAFDLGPGPRKYAAYDKPRAHPSVLELVRLLHLRASDEVSEADDREGRIPAIHLGEQ